MAAFQSEREQLAQMEWLFQQKKFAEGLARTETVLREFPASFHLKFLRYRFLRQLQQPDEALRLLREMHAMSGDNILVVRELADLHFQRKQFAESLLWYRKLAFLDSFNSQAQERIKLLQGMLEAGVSDRLADTKAEFRAEAEKPVPAPPREPAAPAPPPESAAVAPPASPAPEAHGREPEAAPAPAAGGLHFQTASAAELYSQQGMYREALAIYKNLFEKSGSTDHFQKIQAILRRQRAEQGRRTIERLQRFQDALKKRESPIV